MSATDHRFPPIGSYGFLSDCHTGALVSYDGSVEWLCLPRFDSPSAFAAAARPRRRPLQARRRAASIVPISRRYEPGTLVIETTWVTDTGWVVVHDALTIGDWATPRPASRGRGPSTSPTTRCCGLMTCIDGEVEMEMECLPRFAYGAEAADWSGGELGEATGPRPPTAPSCA